MNIIACMAKNRVIGKNGKMPWHIKEDLKYFKEKTMYKTIIMGRKTFESLPGLLPNRKHIILSRKPFDSEYPQIEVTNLEEIKKNIKAYEDDFIIGGGEIYEKMLPYAKKLYITLVNIELEGDTYFPKINYDEWNLTKERESNNEQYNYKFLVYERKNL
ncbi:MAG: dihydrofolate reductase [Defluviitaleaceae bacterium]|nr:dihydrofolate reductase [Defluviitaleaceae bacterium]